jgi:hypothetical protein
LGGCGDELLAAAGGPVGADEAWADLFAVLTPEEQERAGLDWPSLADRDGAGEEQLAALAHLCGVRPAAAELLGALIIAAERYGWPREKLHHRALVGRWEQNGSADELRNRLKAARERAAQDG